MNEFFLLIKLINDLKDVETIISGPAGFRIFLVKHALKAYFFKKCDNLKLILIFKPKYWHKLLLERLFCKNGVI